MQGSANTLKIQPYYFENKALQKEDYVYWNY